MTTSAPVRHAWAEHDGRRLHRLEFAGTGRPVVCVHGVTSCAWVWHDAVAHGLHGAGRAVAVDLRGHGDSGWAEPQRYRTVDHADDLEAVLGPFGSSVDLVGSSWGALVALAVAARRPDLVHQLVLVDIEPSFAQSETDVPPRPARFAGLADAGAFWRSNNPAAPDGLVQLLAAASTRPAPGGGLMPAHDPLFLARWPFRSEDWWDALDGVAAPTLVVHAERSWVRAEVCDRMAARLARAERVDIASAHVVPVDAPEALARAVAGFLAE
ncbi:MAG TPA: alpha/beta hydrolase [Acidimicrobiales bacterium]|nr:alpha/beta hydrolase [Acidimicrobiales bacterium]